MDHEDIGHSILIATWTLVGLSGLFLAVRLICKLRTKRHLWWDDHVLTISWLMLLTSIVLVTISITKGLGKHAYDVPPQNFPFLGLIGNFTGTFSILAATWSKTAFAITLLRLMPGRTRFLLWFIIATVNISMGLNAVFMWTRCSPVSKTWNPYTPGTCWEPHVYPTYGMFAAGYSAAMDFVLALLPWKVIWKLQMRRKEKIGVALAMSMGIFAGGTAIVKTLEIPVLASEDFTCEVPIIFTMSTVLACLTLVHETVVAAGLINWGAAESAVTIIAASIPVLRTLFMDFRSLSKRYYLPESNNQTQISRVVTTTRRTIRNNTVVISGGPLTSHLTQTMTNSSDEMPLKDPAGQILQRTEVTVAVELRDKEGGRDVSSASSIIGGGRPDKL